jgi:two-component system OmpR family response regulator
MSMRVLLVEDNNDTLATMAAVLRFERYEVVTATDGRVALEMAKLEPPDVVLLDIGLPGMDGYKVAQALRDLASGRRLYIAAKQRAADAGIDAHLTKPAPPSAIIDLLQSLRSKV